MSPPAKKKRASKKGAPARKKATNKLPPIRQDVADTLHELLAGQPGVKPGKMFGMPAYYAGGKLFASIYGDGVCVKLPPELLASCTGKPGFAPFEPMGRTMTGWLLLTRKRATDYRKDLDLFLAARDFVAQEGRGPFDKLRAGQRRPYTHS